MFPALKSPAQAGYTEQAKQAGHTCNLLAFSPPPSQNVRQVGGGGGGIGQISRARGGQVERERERRQQVDAGIEAGPCTSWWEAQREQAENNAPSQRCSRSRAGHLRYFSRHRLTVLSVHVKKKVAQSAKAQSKIFTRGWLCIHV